MKEWLWTPWEIRQQFRQEHTIEETCSFSFFFPFAKSYLKVICLENYVLVIIIGILVCQFNIFFYYRVPFGILGKILFSLEYSSCWSLLVIQYSFLNILLDRVSKKFYPFSWLLLFKDDETVSSTVTHNINFYNLHKNN